MNHNCKDHRGVTHAMNDAYTTAYNATSWQAWCGIALIGTTWTRNRVDCMTCLVAAARG